MPDTEEIERIHCLTGEILRKASTREGTCLFRGEPECYPVVSTGLWRACPEGKDEMFDIGQMEQEIVERARDYTTLADPEEEILAEIQHFGGLTNLLDFTDDYLVASFFASVKSGEADGRVVLHWPDSERVIRPKHTNHRVVFQKSVFVRPRRGFIVPDALEEVVVVPRDLKASMLTFLERYHGISERSVYNDIHGFIRQQNPSRSGYAASFRSSLGSPHHREGPRLGDCVVAGLDKVKRISARYYHHQRGMDYTDCMGSVFVLDTMTKGPGKRIELRPDGVVHLLTHCIEHKVGGVRLEEAYCWRGVARLFQDSDELAAADFERALELDGELAEAYHGRASLRIQQGDAESAKADLEDALRLDPGLRPALIDRGNMLLEDGALDAAIRDFDAAMAGSRMPDGLPLMSNYTWFRDGRFLRAVARCMQEDWHNAEVDLAWARQGGLRIASSFRSKFGGVERFEEKYGVRLPCSLKTQLHVLEDG